MYPNAKLFYETLADGIDWLFFYVNDDIHSVKWLGTSWLFHVAYTANERTALHLNGWLASTWALCSMLSEFLWNPPPSQLHLHCKNLHFLVTSSTEMLRSVNFWLQSVTWIVIFLLAQPLLKFYGTHVFISLVNFGIANC